MYSCAKHNRMKEKVNGVNMTADIAKHIVNGQIVAAEMVKN